MTAMVTVMGSVEQLPVDRIEVVEAAPPTPLSDRELAFLKPVGHVLEGRDRESLAHVAYLPWISTGLRHAPPA